MIFGGPLHSATLISRPNRFLGVVDLGGVTTRCFIPDPGRLEELLRPGSKAYLIERASPTRKTSYDMVLVNLDGVLVSTDSRVPNKVFEEALNADALAEFRGFRIEKRETVFGDSRLDFSLTNGEEPILLEAKSCTLVKDGFGLFPDAPTSRGLRHVHELVKALSLGRAAVLFLIQRGDVKALRPYRERDPKFAQALEDAVDEGVEVYAYSSNVTLEGISIKESVPVMF